MAKARLTYKFIEALKPEKKDVIYWDTDFKGGAFGVRSYKTGFKTYLFNYRNSAGKQCRTTIGATDTISLADARKKALELLLRVSKGEDPLEEKNEYKEAITFSELCSLFLKFKKTQIRTITLTEYQRVIEKELKPIWGDRKMIDIQRKHIIALLDGIITGRNAKTMAQRIKSLIHHIFGFALQRGHISTNPATNIDINAKYVRKTRFLSEKELEIFFKTIDNTLQPQVGNILKLILVTGQRPGEVASLQWSEIEADIWTLPSHKAKNKLEHSIPLVGIAKQILSEIKAEQIDISQVSQSEPPLHVFPSHTGNGMHTRWFTHACKRLVTAMGVEPFTPRDLRRTSATHIRGLGFSMETIKKLLNHKEDSSNVTAIYNRYNEIKEIREALTLWSERLDRIKSGERFQDKVIPISDAILKKVA